MKVALLVPGGVDRSNTERVIPALLWLIRSLGREHELHVFARAQEHDPGEWQIPGATVHNIGLTGGHRLRLMQTFQRVHRAAPFRVIHGMFGWGGTWAALLGTRFHLPVIFHATGGEFVGMPEIAYGMQCTVRDRVAVTVATSGATRVTVPTLSMQSLAQSYGIASSVVPLGVDLDQWPPLAPRARDVTRPARLLHVGDLRPVKDQATLLRALAILAEQGTSFEIDLCGYDTLDGLLQRSADAQRIAPRARWHGVVGRQDLRALVEEADVLVMSSRHEAEPIAVLEAAVAGVPTVGTAVGHLADWAPHAALSVPVGDAVALAACIGALLTDDSRRLALAHAAHEKALALNADASARAFGAIYAELSHA